MTISGFSVSGLKCASGYTGTPQAAVCSGNSAEYKLSGCQTTTTTPAPTPTPAPTAAPTPAPTTTTKAPVLPEWWCPADRDDPDHLHRAKYKCGHCHARYMGPWVSVMIALVIEIILMICVAVLTSERKRLGRITMGRFVPRKKTAAVYEKGKFTNGKFKSLEWEPSKFQRGRFRYIEPETINLAKLIFTDRAKRKWTVFLKRGDAIKAQEHFYNVQSQQTRQKYQSHNDLTRR